MMREHEQSSSEMNSKFEVDQSDGIDCKESASLAGYYYAWIHPGFHLSLCSCCCHEITINRYGICLTLSKIKRETSRYRSSMQELATHRHRSQVQHQEGA